ncbi:chaperonin 10-like protein [Mycena polygramma]|nr:chaperonin 10-like protein [Mycena polygramma]
MSLEFTVFKGSASDGIVESKTHHDGPIGNHVLVRITHSGICGTDEHFKHADMVLGHEGVGTVEQIGETVDQFKVGDIVGWGLTHKTCGKCEECETGKDYYGIANFHQGSFGSRAIWDASFLFKIPESISPEHAAPLMCGGATVYNVIEVYNIRPRDRVGVFLAKMGASVVSKREESIILGATKFHATKGAEKLNTAKPDHLIVTTSFLPNWNLFMDIMKPNGTIYPLSAPPSSSGGELTLPFTPIFFQGLTIQGSLIAARRASQDAGICGTQQGETDH